MAKHHRKNQGPDPVHSIFDGFFKGLWWLVSFPFKGRKKDEALEKARAEFQSHMVTIEASITDPSHYKSAIMNADILLNKALEFKNIPGATLGDRLKAATGRLQRETLDAAWRAHKVRNRLAHELHATVSETEVKQAMSDFKKVLRELGLL